MKEKDKDQETTKNSPQESKDPGNRRGKNPQIIPMRGSESGIYYEKHSRSKEPLEIKKEDCKLKL
jgi:hypothetical protein